MTERRRYPRKKQPTRRRISLDPVLWAGIAATALVLVLARGPLAGGELALAAEAEQVLGAQVDPAPTPAVAQDQPTALPTPPPDLPSLNDEAVTIALAFDAALNAGDVETAMSMFNDEAQVKIPPDVYKGPSQIRNWATYLVENHFASEPGLRHVNRDHSITWPAEVRSDQLVRFGVSSLQGDATLTEQGGRIDSYTFVLTRESASRLRTAQIAAAEILQDPLVVGADLANVYGPADVFRASDGTLVSYHDMVAAEPGTGPFFDLGGEPVILRTGL